MIDDLLFYLACYAAGGGAWVLLSNAFGLARANNLMADAVVFALWPVSFLGTVGWLVNWVFRGGR